MKTFFGRSIFGFIMAIAANSGLFAQTGYDLTVHAGGRQTFKSFGASQVTDTNIPSPAREEMTDLVYGGSWHESAVTMAGNGIGCIGPDDENAFYNQYVNNNPIGLIQSRIAELPHFCWRRPSVIISLPSPSRIIPQRLPNSSWR